MRLGELRAIHQYEVPANEVVELHKELGEKPSVIARCFGVSRATYYRWREDGIPEGPAAKLFRIFRLNYNLNR